MFRCTMPVFTCILEFLIYRTVRPTRVYLSLIPVIIGTMLVCAGDVWVQKGEWGLDLRHLFRRDSPYHQLHNLFVKGNYYEIPSFRAAASQHLPIIEPCTFPSLSWLPRIPPFPSWKSSRFLSSMTLHSGPIGFPSFDFFVFLSSAKFGAILLLAFHGMLAFMLNIANFNAVKEGGPLMMNVVGNVKQVVMIILSVVLFKNKMKPIGVFGSIICITGSMWYSMGRDGELKWGIETSRARRVEAYRIEKEEEEEEEEGGKGDTERLIKNRDQVCFVCLEERKWEEGRVRLIKNRD